MNYSRSLQNYQYSIEGLTFHKNVTPVLVIISGNSLVFPRKDITSIGPYWCCNSTVSAPVVVKDESDESPGWLSVWRQLGVQEVAWIAM